MELVSVIVPVYNVSAFLDVCIESIVGQTYKNIEVIIVDDGSSDESGKIADRWAKQDSRIRVIHKENGGLSSARNAALDLAKGEYIAMIDSDDFWDSGAVELLITKAKENNADMVIARGQRVDLDGNRYSENLKDIAIHEEGVISEDEFWKRRPSDMFYVVAWSKLYRKELFDEIRFPEGEINEDVAVLWKIVSKCKKIYASDKKIYNWRITPNSITRSKFGYRNLFLTKVLLSEVEYIKTADISDRVKYLTMNNAFSYSVDILAKAYMNFEDPIQIEETNQIYLKYKPIARELRKKVRLSDKNALLVVIQMTLFLVSKSGYFTLRKLLKRNEK